MQNRLLLECIKNFPPADLACPKKGDIVTYNGDSPVYPDSIYLVEYPPIGRRAQSFQREYFKEIDDDMDIDALMEYCLRKEKVS